MDAMFIGQSDDPDGRSYVSSEDKQEIRKRYGFQSYRQDGTRLAFG